MDQTTTTTRRQESDFDPNLADYLHARDTLDALPSETTSGEAELLAMDAMGAAERRLFRQTPQNSWRSSLTVTGERLPGPGQENYPSFWSRMARNLRPRGGPAQNCTITVTTSRYWPGAATRAAILP